MNIHVYMYYNTGKVRKGINVSYKTKHMNNCIHFFLSQLIFELQFLLRQQIPVRVNQERKFIRILSGFTLRKMDMTLCFATLFDL